MNSALLFLFTCIGTYLLASIPFGLIIASYKNIDLRKVGSGNIGATNVYRALGKTYAFVVFCLDALKGWIPTFLTITFFENPWHHVLVAVITIVGHSLSCFVKFKGGKGVATGFGVVLAFSPIVAGVIFTLALLFIYITRYVALVSLVCAVITPLCFYLLGYPFPYVVLFVIVGLLIIVRHYKNIFRLISGTENKI